MKKQFLKSVAAVVVICLLSLSLTGCDALDYRRAVGLYNAGRFDGAAKAFAQLEGYEDSAELATRSSYWAAIASVENGKYEEARSRFLELGSFEDSAQWAIECQYQLAVAAFEEERLADAQALFLENPTYRQTPEYLRQISWQELYDALEKLDGIRWEEDGRIINIYPDLPEFDTPTDQLYFSFIHYLTQQDAPYGGHDQVTLVLTRDSAEAVFHAASGFTFDLYGNNIGSTQTAEGRVNIATCTPDTPLVFDTFEKTVTDNLGNTTTSTDPADSLMDDALARNFRELMTTVPLLLGEAGIDITLADIGFSAMG